MPATKLTEFKQSTFIVGGGPAQRGICYYICDYLDNNPKSPWTRPTDFATAVAAVTRMATVSLVAAGKAASLKKVPQHAGYADAMPLLSNSLYRIEVAVGAGAGINHEVMALTGVDKLVLFDPNYGFYLLDAIPAGGFAAAYVAQMAVLYDGTTVGAFGYRRSRKAF